MDQRLPLFYEPQLHAGLLNEAESQHALKALRLRPGDALELTDGQGTQATATVTEVDRRQLRYEVTAEQEHPAPPLPSLAIAPTKSLDRMEWLVEKAAELGVAAVHLFTGQNSERPRLRMDRLQKKLVAAMKQSQRYHLPTLHAQAPWEEVLQRWRSEQLPGVLAVVGHPHSTPFASTWATPRAWVFIGPEGDFSSQEVEQAQNAGLQLVSLGQAVLRTETAALACLATAAQLRGL